MQQHQHFHLCPAHTSASPSAQASSPPPIHERVRAADRDRYLLALAKIDPKVATPEDRAMRRAVELARSPELARTPARHGDQGQPQC